MGACVRAIEWLARHPAPAFVVISLVTLVEGAVLLRFVPTSWLQPHARWEVNAVAMSLATHGSFADPYAVPTGPTAHVPPAYPALLALIYRIVGLTLAAGYVTWFVQVATSAVMVAMLPWLAGRLGLPREAGVIGGLVGALVPRWPQEVEYAAAASMGALIAWHALRWREPHRSARGALLLGAGWGVSFHITPSLLPVMLGCVAFEAWSRRSRRTLALIGVTMLGASIVCLPWTLRNRLVLGDGGFIRSNLGLELRMGNHEGALADLDSSAARAGRALRHPRTNLAEAERVRAMGEAAYMRDALDETLAWIREHPATYARLAAARAFGFWFGSSSQGGGAWLTALLTILAALGARRAWPALDTAGRAAFVIPLGTFPVVYYLVVFMPRYALPLLGMLLMLAGAEAWGWLALSTPAPQAPEPARHA